MYGARTDSFKRMSGRDGSTLLVAYECRASAATSRADHWASVSACAVL
jgi:hypothetical protein